MIRTFHRFAKDRAAPHWPTQRDQHHRQGRPMLQISGSFDAVQQLPIHTAQAHKYYA